MLDEHGHMESQLVKFLLGETDEQETLEVVAWLDASAENRQQFEELKKVWSHTGSPLSAFNADTDAAWNKLKARIDEDEKRVVKEPVVRRLLERPRWNWMAAAVILAIIGLFGIFQYYFNPAEVKVASEERLLEQKLPDGSLIALNAHSKISYPEHFKGKVRKVKLTGEAFFDVKPDTEKPFVIDAGAGEIKVLGTSFNVEAYHGQDLKVQVVSGRVQLSLQGADTDSSVILMAGDVGIIDRSKGQVYKEMPVYDDALFWYNKKLVFKETPLPEVFRILEKNYKVRFSPYGEEVQQCRLTARFEGESIEAILDVISATFDIQFKVQNETVLVSTQENNCAEI